MLSGLNSCLWICLILLASWLTGSSLHAEDKKVALLVGVNNYDRRGLNDLKFAERDVTELAKVLTNLGFEVKTMLGSLERTDPLRATKQNIESTLTSWLLKDRNKQDVVLIAFTGHGVQRERVVEKKDDKGEIFFDIVKNTNGQSEEDAYFCPVDCFKDEVGTLISLTGIMDKFGSKGGINFMLVDACRDDPTRSTRSISGNELNGRLPSNTGVLFSCSAGQQALETGEIGGGHGIFMHHVIEGLKGEAKDPNGNLNWLFLTFYLQQNVNAKAVQLFPDRAKSNPFLQTPHGFNNFTTTPVLASISKPVSPLGFDPDKSPAKVQFETGKLLYGKAAYKEAIEVLNDAIRLDPQHELAYNLRGNCLNMINEVEQAFADYNEAYRLNPGYINPVINRALYWKSKRQFDKATTEFELAEKIDPKFISLYTFRGLYWLEQQNYEKALVDYTEAIRLDPVLLTAYNNRSYIYRTLGDYDNAMADANEAIRINPKYPNAYVNRGTVYHERKEYDKALQEFEEAIRLDPKMGNAYYNRGYTFAIMKQYPKALADYNEAVRLGQKSSDIFADRGKLFYLQNEQDKALADLNEAITINPKNPSAYDYRGSVWMAKEEYDKALDDYTMAIKLGIKNAFIYSNRGLAYFFKKQYDKAIPEYDQALALDANSFDAYYGRGNCWKYKKSYDKAIADYNEAIRINPNYGPTYFNRGIVNRDKGDMTKASQDREKAKALGYPPK
jgi:tetratricopeptide (TPR) repeat protein